MDHSPAPWGLSQIDEGVEHLDISGNNFPPPPPPVTGGTQADYVTFKEVTDVTTNTKPKHQDDTQIYSDTSIIVQKPHAKTEKDLIEEGLKKLSDKYESLERVKPKLTADMSASDSGNIFQFPDPSKVASSGEILPDGVRPPSPVPLDHNPNENSLTDHDILQADMFYRSHKSEVFVCPTLANLYFGTVKKSGPVDMSTLDDWQYKRTGIPVLVLDSGESRRDRKLHIILAERGTGFTLWRDQINHLTNYSAPHVSYHTMHLSSDHTKIAGFSYDDSGAASDFLHKIIELTSDPDDDVLNLSRTGKSKKSHKDKEKKSWSKKKYKAPTKADISQPCCFTHITKIDRPELTPPQPSTSGIPLPPKCSVSTASIQRRHSGLMATTSSSH